MLGRRLTPLVVGGALLALTACTAGSDAEDFQQPQLLKAWENEGATPSPLQSKILDDNKITEAEYRSAVESAADCLVDRGWDVGDLELRNDGLTYSFSISGDSSIDTEAGTAEEGDRLDRDYNDCTHDTTSNLEQAYFDQHVLTGKEREEAFERLESCLASEGIEAAVAGMTVEEIYETIGEEAANSAAGECINAETLLFPATGSS